MGSVGDVFLVPRSVLGFTLAWRRIVAMSSHTWAGIDSITWPALLVHAASELRILCCRACPQRSVWLLALIGLASLAARPAQPDDLRQQDIDRKLQAFCMSAILRDRGLANNMSGLGTDAWVSSQLLPRAEFRSALAALPALTESDVSLTKAGITHDPIEEFYLQRIPSVGERIRSQLSESDVGKLPYVYLQIEGMMALCRPEFGSLFEDPISRQKQIREIFVSAWNERAAPAHRALFTLNEDTKDEAPTFIAVLRQVSAQSDQQAMQLLTQVERQRLWELVRVSSSLVPALRTPGSSVTQ